MRIDHQMQSLHYFHSFAVKDRVSFSSLPNTASLINPAEIDLQCFLPTADDQLVLEENLCVPGWWFSTFHFFENVLAK